MGTKKKPKNRLQDLSKEALLQYVRSQPDQTVGFRHLLDYLEADKTERKQIKEILGQLVRDKKLVRHKGNRYEALPSVPLYQGEIAVHADGYGFVRPLETIPGIKRDVFIPPPATGTAMDGDRVTFVITSIEDSAGRVVGIEERARHRIVGQLRFDGDAYFVSPADSRLPAKILVSGDVSEHKDKMVEVELTRFGSEQHWPAAGIVSVLGFIDDPDVETTVVIKKYGLRVDFPAEVDAEVAQLPTALTKEDLKGRTDFRNRETITIDPATARDFDDAVDIEEIDGVGFRVGVLIADVAHFVTLGSATDREARTRGCSVYFPDRVVPMLPEKLSNDICSLNPLTDRLTMSVLMDVTEDGLVTAPTLHQGLIHSRERMTYETVQKILDGDAASRKRHHSLVGTIEALARASRALFLRRRKVGTIDFDLPEPELTYDAAGLVEGIAKAPRYFSHRMIEEFMIAANEAVARILEKETRSTIFRIHEPPDPERIGELTDTLAEFGLRFRPKKITPSAFQNFLTSIEGRPDEQMISFLVLRSFRQAVYSTRNRGHFGLASACYTHFTSPIRRYPDLVIHRLLKAHVMGEPPTGYATTDLEAIADESSARERIADEAERDLFRWKQMILLEEHLGDTLDAIIIHVFDKGMRVELVDYFIEGFVSVEDMVDDYYEFNRRQRRLVGRGTRRQYGLGQTVRVQVARIDKLLGRAYFLPVLANATDSD